MPKRRQSKLEFWFKDRTLLVFKDRKEARRITAWPTPIAERPGKYEKWERVAPIYRIISQPLPAPKTAPDNQLELVLDIDTSDKTLKSGTCSKKVAYDRLRQTIPDEYSSRLAPFYSHQWNPLRFLSKNESFLDLLKSNPPLAYFLANHSATSERVFCDLLSIDALIRTPQTDLMETLHLPNTKQAVRLMRKLAPESTSPENLILFKHILQSKERAKQIRHLQRIKMRCFSTRREIKGGKATLLPHFPRVREILENKKTPKH